tara:strand:+ start:34 stop:2625 length:2592 start_codon:yes stop_codon:yes gene_type:complete
MTEKYYQLGTHTPEQWPELHDELNADGLGSVERCVECTDHKEHSPTRGEYLLTDAEAEILKADPRIKFININYARYPDEFKPTPEELTNGGRIDPKLRYTGSVKNYRTFPNDAGEVDRTTLAELNRTSYSLLRMQQKLDPWIDGSYSPLTVIESNISQYGSGKNVDIIVGDDGCWFGHPEFQRTSNDEKPTDYVGGNVLPGNGYCDLLDVILDAPYYLDPEWFNADPDNRLTTRWDNTIVPVESFARAWWSSGAQRSAQFASAGTVSVDSGYTRAYCNGSNTNVSIIGTHGTACAGLAYGRNKGWAYNANKWFVNAYNSYSPSFDGYFDLVKIFHQLKPVNPTYGNKNPTVNSNSWGFRASKGAVNDYYHFRQDDAVQYGGTSAEPAFISHMGVTGDGGRWKSEMKTNSYTQALDELIDAGVIFVVAAGNSNQKQVKWDHPDYNNYISATAGQTLEQSQYYEFSTEVTGSTNRRGFPQQGGKKILEGGQIVHGAINIGALDDGFDTSNGNKERKVSYSDRGNDIDLYAPANGALTSNKGYVGPSIAYNPATYPEYGVFPEFLPLYDAGFSGFYSSNGTLLADFSVEPNSAYRFTSTAFGVGSATAISNNFQNTTSNNTLRTSGSASMGWYDISVPWEFELDGTNIYSTVGISTNGYLLHGQGSLQTITDTPRTGKTGIYVSAGNHSVQNVYYEIQGTTPNRKLVIRSVGLYDEFGNGQAVMENEWHLFENDPNSIELHMQENGAWVRGFTTLPNFISDTKFGGTSAACPAAAGLLATVLEHNRSWTWESIKDWSATLDIQDPSVFFQGTESLTATDSNWFNYTSLEGGVPLVLYQGNVSSSRIKRVMSGPLKLNGKLQIRFKQ